MAITGTPTVIEAGATFDRWWISSLKINGTNPANVTSEVFLRKYRLLGDGAVQFSPIDRAVVINVNDVLGQAAARAAAGKPALAQAMEALITAIQENAVEEGKI